MPVLFTHDRIVDEPINSLCRRRSGRLPRKAPRCWGALRGPWPSASWRYIERGWDLSMGFFNGIRRILAGGPKTGAEENKPAPPKAAAPKSAARKKSPAAEQLVEPAIHVVIDGKPL